MQLIKNNQNRYVVLIHFQAYCRYCYDIFDITHIVSHLDEVSINCVKDIINTFIKEKCDTSILYWYVLLDCDSVSYSSNLFSEEEQSNSFTLIDSSVLNTLNPINKIEEIDMKMFISYERFMNNQDYLIRRISFIHSNITESEKHKEYIIYNINKSSFNLVNKHFQLTKR